MTLEEIRKRLSPFGFNVEYCANPRSPEVSIRIDKGAKARIYNFSSYEEYSKIDTDYFMKEVCAEFGSSVFEEAIRNTVKDPLKEILEHSFEEALRYDERFPKVGHLPVEELMSKGIVSDRIVDRVSPYLGADLDITQEIKKCIAEEFEKRDKHRAEHLTNREWLMSLTDEEFAAWCIKTAPELPGIPDPLMPRLGDLKHAYKDTYSGIIDWLRQPRNIIKEEE